MLSVAALLLVVKAPPSEWSGQQKLATESEFSSIDFPIRLVVTHRNIRAVLAHYNIQRYSPLWRELHRWSLHHSFGGICHRVVLVNNQLSGFAFKLCAEISFFHWSTCVVLRWAYHLCSGGQIQCATSERFSGNLSSGGQHHFRHTQYSPRQVSHAPDRGMNNLIIILQ